MFLIIFFFMGMVPQAVAEAVSNSKMNFSDDKFENQDQSLKTLYKDIIVLQDMGFEHKGSFVFGTRFGMNFSDGPQSTNPVSFTIGYGISNSFELDLYAEPFFLIRTRPITGEIQKLNLANGQSVDVVSVERNFSGGLQGLWFLAYGKDAVAKTIIRSDTFLRFGLGEVKFAGGKSGLDYSLAIGKTYYLNPFLNIRADMGIVYSAYILEQKAQNILEGMLNLGLEWRL